MTFDWDDLRFFLAVARAGTTLGAARALGSSQPTVVRRIGRFEAATGLALFERSPAGYALSEAGRLILPLAERCQAEIQSVADAIDSRRGGAAGTIRLTIPVVVDAFLLEMLQQYRESWPGVEVQILTSFRRFDLARGEADMAIRAGPSPDPESVYVRPLPMACFAVYASRAYAQRNQLPDSAAALSRHPVVVGEGNVAALPAFQWLERAAAGAAVALRCNSFNALQSALRAGLGISVLPCAMGERDTELVRCFDPVPDLTVPLWLAVRRELRRRPAVRALFETIERHMMEHAALFAGESSTPAPRPEVWPLPASGPPVGAT